jgi:hypothetical protein
MCSLEDLFDENEIDKFKEDVYLECSRFGDILEIEIPVPGSSSALEEKEE